MSNAPTPDPEPVAILVPWEMADDLRAVAPAYDLTRDALAARILGEWVEALDARNPFRALDPLAYPGDELAARRRRSTDLP